MSDTDRFHELRERLEQRLAQIERVLSESAIELRDGFARERRRLRAALDRIREERYGVCCACEAELPVDQLLADPAAPFCGPCETEIKESKRNR